MAQQVESAGKESQMTLSEVLLPEFDQEMAGTRKTLERVPDDKFGWNPHAKSMTMGQLVGHLADNPGWAVLAVKVESLDLAPPGGEPYKPSVVNSRAEALKLFDKNVAEAKKAIAAASDERLLKPWTLLSGGKEILTLSSLAVIRSFVLNHTIHHRAQLGVCLRLNDIPVPGLYGPSADEGGA
jgi:uncharacterized damage-inducible protein DinB